MMASWSRWIGLGIALGMIWALLPIVRGNITVEETLGKVKPKPAPAVTQRLAGLDLTRIKVSPGQVTAPLAGQRRAHLTLDPDVQRAARSQMRRYRVPEAGVVVIETKTGRVLAYSSYVHEGKAFDVNARAEAPAASVFKLVTGAALVENAGLTARTEQCYHGGRSRIVASELIDNPSLDNRCLKLSMALGRSANVVFGRLASKHLTRDELVTMGGAFGFGSSVPFAVSNEPPKIDIPEEPLEFARSAAGFWHTSLSPLAGAVLAQTIANGGVALVPRIVEAVHDGEKILWTAQDKAQVLRRAIRRETSVELRRMMIQTVASGSAFKTFHDPKGRPYLPGMQIAGKTGSLTRHAKNRHYTWFVGFAPAHKPEVAISALVVNTPLWHIKGPQLAREVLRAYFAKKGRKGVTQPG